MWIFRACYVMLHSVAAWTGLCSSRQCFTYAQFNVPYLLPHHFIFSCFLVVLLQPVCVFHLDDLRIWNEDDLSLLLIFLAPKNTVCWWSFLTVQTTCSLTLLQHTFPFHIVKTRRQASVSNLGKFMLEIRWHYLLS